VRTAGAVLVRPWLWPTAVEQTVRLARPRWWRRPPFLPVTDRRYLQFRLMTAYGDERDPEPEEVLTYLRWCRTFPKAQ
jgi:hypothetical protein